MMFPELEAAADALIVEFGVTSPPVPIDTIMMTPKPGMWPKIDLGRSTLSFTSRGDRFAPRISIARLVVRQVVHTEWGIQHKLPRPRRLRTRPYRRLRAYGVDAVVVDRKLPERDRNPIGIAMAFMVPEDDAELRLNLRTDKDKPQP
ncbi:MAG: hypothetical protein HND48_05130 [Chloroflexi bacterium]|nr:hypothetical protein [Chloroflexota bacterium]